MNEKVVSFPGVSTLDSDPDRVLTAAIGEVEGVVICGKGKDGTLFFASSYADGGDCLWYLMRAQHALMHIAEKIEEEST